jgi:hypothetical protein
MISTIIQKIKDFFNIPDPIAKVKIEPIILEKGKVEQIFVPDFSKMNPNLTNNFSKIDWLVKEGDLVKPGQAIVEFEDKNQDLIFELENYYQGRIKNLQHYSGDFKAGDLLFEIEGV